MKKIAQKYIALAKRHKTIATLIGVVIVVVGYYGIRSLTSTSGETRYVLTPVTRGTLISSVSGSGQVSASNQVDLKPKASGDVVYLGAVNGQEVKAGAFIAQLDTSDAQKVVRDAEANVTSAELSLQKLELPADNLSLLQSEHSLAKAKESKQDAETALVKSYEDGFTAISNTFLDMPAEMTGMQDLLYSMTRELVGSSGQWNLDYYADATARYNDSAPKFKDDVTVKYAAARTAYEKNFLDYKELTRSSDNSLIESVVAETYETSKKMAEAIKSANNLIQLYKDEMTKHMHTPSPTADTHLATLNSYTGTNNSHLSSLLAIQTTIQGNKDAIVNAGRTIAEDEASLTKLKNGADELDLKSSRLTLTTRQNALADAKANLAHYFVRAPFDGTITKIAVRKGDSATSGTVLATLLTKQKIAELSLNEVDVAKISVGQKATLTFDAIEGLTMSGKVLEIDTLGTVSQGVVTYAVKIGFDTDDSRIKAGMSVSASIITSVKSDVLLVPVGAVKTRGMASYVETLSSVTSAEAEHAGSSGIPSTVAPSQKTVEVGISNDTETEITSGLSDGDLIITRTVTATTAQTQTPSLFSAIGGGGRGATGGAGGGTRAITR